MKYVVMAGGKYKGFRKHLVKINGETLVERTIRLLREAGAEDIAISSNQEGFENMGVPVLTHPNGYRQEIEATYGDWLDAFYPSEEPICYLFGDVVFSPEAIKTIVDTKTDDIMFFASAEPLPKGYPKPWAEPFAYKVVDTHRFFLAIEMTKEYEKQGCFYRQPVSWEIWQVIKGTPLGKIDYTNYCAINDYTCDIDCREDMELFRFLGEVSYEY